MKIGDTVFIHGYIDEIRKDMVIIRNNGGYFGTVPSEIICGEMPERKTGKWYKPTGMMPPEYAGVYRCSECDGLAMRDWKTHKQTLTDFCPYCNADMRQEGEASGKK